MTAQLRRGPVVIDTDVYGADLVPGSALAVIYEPIIAGRPAFISFQTSAELRYGALRRNWGAARMRKLAARIAEAETVHSGPELVAVYAHSASTANGSATRSASATTTRTAGSQPPPSGSASRSSPTTRSSRTSRAWCSSRRPGGDRHRVRPVSCPLRARHVPVANGNPGFSRSPADKLQGHLHPL